MKTYAILTIIFALGFAVKTRIITNETEGNTSNVTTEIESTKRLISPSSLPEVVKNVLKDEEFEGFGIDEVYMVFEPRFSYFEISMVNGDKTMKVNVKSDGEISGKEVENLSGI